MDNDILNFNNKIYSNNNNILLQIINDLNQLMYSIHDNIIIKRISDIINKINYIVNENKKNFQLIRNDITSLEKKINKRFDKLEINNKINNQEIKYKDGRYIGEVVNGLAEGKGIFYANIEPFKGNIYEGDFRNGLNEGKEIYYYNNGDRSMGDYYNGNPIGKHVMLTRNGEVKIINY